MYRNYYKKKNLKDNLEESIINFSIVSDDLLQYFESLLMDEIKEYGLGKIVKNKSGTKVIESNQMTMVTKFNFSWSRKMSKPRIERYKRSRAVPSSKKLNGLCLGHS